MAPILDKLDDVCLQKVFSFLHLSELPLTAGVCKKFKRNAEEAFKSKYTNLDLLKLIEGNQDYHQEWYTVRWLSEEFLKSAEQLFVNFGSFIEELTLTGIGDKNGMDENELLMLAKANCPTLKRLTLNDIGNDDKFSAELVHLFAGVEELTVSTSDVCDSFVDIFSDCHELKCLNVSYVPSPMWINHKFPKLETLNILDSLQFDSTDFESFLKTHESLRTLRYHDYWMGSDIFAVISKCSPKLETFCCKFEEMMDYDDDEVDENIVNENILQLATLSSLKNLTFMSKESAMKLLVDALENSLIEHLEIVDCPIGCEMIVGISKLQSLKTLKLTQCEIAAETLIAGKLPLADNVTVRIVNSPTKLARQLPDQQSADILTILNDDCLMQIFELLPLPDLCNVADVCQRFLQNCQTIFQMRHTVFETNQIAKLAEYGLKYTDMQVAEKLFRNFGFFIQNLTLKGGCLKSTKDEETMLYLATKYCISTSFETLTLDRISIKGPMRWILPLFPMFYSISKLELYACRLDKDFGKFLSVCQIPTIHVLSIYGSGEWMTHTFWHLQTLVLIEIFQPEAAMNEFIKLNGHIQSLVIHQSNLSSKIFKTVAHHMPNLRQFCFAGKNPSDRRTGKNVLHLVRLKSLTSLRLNCASFSVKHLLDELAKETIPITELYISFGTVDMELVDRLVNLRSLTNLALRRNKMNEVTLVDLVKKLPGLNELYIDIIGIDVKGIVKMLPYAQNLSKLSIGSERAYVQIGVVEYQSILEIVKGREKARKLCITIESEHRQVFVPAKLQQENSYWVKLENDIIENLRSDMSDSESDAELSDNGTSSDEESDESDEESGVSVEDSNQESGQSDEESDQSVDDSDADIEMESMEQ